MPELSNGIDDPDASREKRFLEFHKLVFRAQAYNRPMFLEDLAEDFLEGHRRDSDEMPCTRQDVEKFLGDYSRWETQYVDTKAAE